METSASFEARSAASSYPTSSTASLQNTCLATAADNIEALRDRAFEHFLLSLSAIVGSLIGD